MGIFEPFRAIGYITSTVPFSVQRLGTETFVTVSVGKAFQIYNCAKLNLVIISPQLPKKIRALASYRDFTFAAFGNEIAVFKRAHQVATWSKHVAKVDLLLLFGEHVLSLDVEGNMFIWAFKGIEEHLAPVGHVELCEKFTPTCIVHPDTYLNKVLVGSQEGPLQLWNINTKKMLYQFKGWGSPVCCCVSSPALDVVAIGCADGKIHVHNLKLDQEIVTFEHASRGAVTALSFSTDGRPLLASGGSFGVISIWNLNKRRLQSVIRDAHDSSIISLNFLANEPVLMSASADNSLKMWIFDTNDGDPRLLRFRSGHSAPPLCIRFYSNGRHILSAGQDRAFRLFSVIQEQQSRELSQRHISRRAKKLRLKEEELKLKPVIAFDCAEIRERDWCNVVTCHMDTAEAYVWRLQNFVLGEHILKPCPENPTPIKACAISACGNFAVVGTASGWIERFNLQSGISRGSYMDKSETRSYSHDGEVIGVACDSTNTLMISAGYHGDIKVWDFKKRELKSRWDVGCSLVKIIYHRVNGLLATVANDFVIRLYDVVALRMVREFRGHTDRITDLCFSEDGKWLLSSSMDGSLRIWDVILAKQIDGVHVDVPITALSLSPNMDILATAHSDQNGVYLWVNQSMYSGAPNVDSYASGKNVVNVRLPSVSALRSSEADADDKKTQVSENSESATAASFSISPEQIPELVTLSLLPKSQWQSLINLDIIKARNKPIEPPKKPEKAPFFLPSIPSLSGDIVFKSNESDNDGEDEDKNKDSKNSMKNFDALESPFSKLLKSSWDSKYFSNFTDYIKGLSPSALDIELRMLEIIDEDVEEELIQRPEFISIGQLLDYLIHEITCRNNFEFMQAVMRLFLKIHGETIRCHPSLQEKARKLLETQSLVWQKMDIAYLSPPISFLSAESLLLVSSPYDPQKQKAEMAEEKKVAPIGVWTAVKPFVNGGASGMLATCVIQPIDMIKVRIQLGQGSAVSVTKNMLKNDGIGAFYKGLSAGLLRQATYTTARLGSFKMLTAKAIEANDGKPLPLYQKALCGLTAGAIGACVGSPADLALIRMQADNTLPLAQRRNYTNAFHALYRISADEGVLALWKGCGPTVVRAMALNMGMLASYDQSAEYMRDNLGLGETSTVVGASAVSGFCAAACSLPFDYVKTQIQKMQPDAQGKYPYTGSLDCAMQTLKSGGPLKFYTGFPVYCVRIAPHVMMTWIFLNQITKFQKTIGL